MNHIASVHSGQATRTAAAEEAISKIFDDLKRFVSEAKSEMRSLPGSSGRSSEERQVRDAIDPAKELQISVLKDGVSKEEFAAWRSGVEIRIECLRGCSTGQPLPKAVRNEKAPIDIDVSEGIKRDLELSYAADPHADPPHPGKAAQMSSFDLAKWEFQSKALLIFLLLNNKLNKQFNKLCAKWSL